MKNLPGPDSLVLATQLEAIVRQLGESQAMTDIGQTSAAKAELLGAQAKAQELARNLRQDNDLEAWAALLDGYPPSGTGRHRWGTVAAVAFVALLVIGFAVIGAVTK